LAGVIIGIAVAALGDAIATLARTLDDANAKSYAFVIARRRVEDANMTGEDGASTCAGTRARANGRVRGETV
tara:strand:- start:186 stop:401 length:216 start_codon:yes stop_codon:yes gene_type:complete